MTEQDDFDLPENIAPEESAYETDYTTGQDNIQFLGLDIHNPVFFSSAFLVLIFAIGTLGFPDKAQVVLEGARDWTLEYADWYFVLSTNIIFLFCVFLALSPLGNIKIGGEDAQPEFGRLSWVSMLFSAGMGIGLMFYGAAEPLAYYTDWFGTPLNVEPLTPEAERLAFSASIFHWGFTPWAVYAVLGLSLAFFTFSKGLPLSIRSIFYPLLGERVWGWTGHVIDTIAVLATLFGLATSLGIGAKQAAGGFDFLFGTGNGLSMQIFLIAGITSLAVVSVIRGLDGGIRLLSNVNICLAFCLLIFVFLTGPTAQLAGKLVPNTLGYFGESVRLSNWIGREDTEWFHGWTIFYWAWWISWSPFVGMFIARVSLGRTVREFLAAVLVLPVIVTVIWFTVFGGTAIDQMQQEAGPLADGIGDVSLVLFQMLRELPLSEISAFLSVMLVVVFFVTSSDSGSLVIDSITAGGKLHAPTPQRIFWAVMEGLVASVLLIGGGSVALSTMQAGAITTGLPFAVVLLMCCVSLYVGLSQEWRRLKEDVSDK